MSTAENLCKDKEGEKTCKKEIKAAEEKGATRNTPSNVSDCQETSDDKIVNSSVNARSILKEQSSEQKEVRTEKECQQTKKKRTPCPWQIHPPPQPFKKARYAWQIKNYEHTLSRMKTSIEQQQQQQQQQQQSSSQCANTGYRNGTESVASDQCRSSVASHYPGMYNNIQTGYPMNLYSPLLRWSKLAASAPVDTPVNRVLQSIFFSGNEPPPDLHPLLMLSLAEGHNTSSLSENFNCDDMPSNLEQMSSNVLPSQLQSGLPCSGSPLGIHSPPTSDYDSSSDDTSLGEDLLPDTPMMQQYQQLHSYQMNGPQNYEDLIQQHTAAAIACRRLQQHQNIHESSEEPDANLMFQSAMMNCSLGLQNRHFFNLQLQNLCERMQADRSVMPFPSYQQHFPANSHEVSDYRDDGRGMSTLDSFRRNTPSETESENTQTTVPLVSNSSVATDDSQPDSVHSGKNAEEGLPFGEALHPASDGSLLRREADSELSDDSDTDLSLSDDSTSDIAAVAGVGYTCIKQEGDGPIGAGEEKVMPVKLDVVESKPIDNSNVGEKDQGKGCSLQISDGLEKKASSAKLLGKLEDNGKVSESTEDVENRQRSNSSFDGNLSSCSPLSYQSVDNNSIIDNNCPRECCAEDCEETKRSKLAILSREENSSPDRFIKCLSCVSGCDNKNLDNKVLATNDVTVLTCNCLIAKDSSSSPVSEESAKSPERSPEDCQECCLQQHKKAAEKAPLHHICDNNNDKYFFDQAFHVPIKQDLGYQKA